MHSHAIMCVGRQRPSLRPVTATIDRYLPFYHKVTHYLSEGYAVIYVVEHDTLQVIRNLSKIGIEVEDHVESGALTIIDADSFYSPSETKFDYRILLAQWQQAIASRKKDDFKKIMVMGMPHRAFFDSQVNQQKLIEYEEYAAKSYDNDDGVQIFCCYIKELIDQLPLAYVIRLLAAHQDIARINYNETKRNDDNTWNARRKILDLIADGLTEALGKESSFLVFKTLKFVYKMDENSIISQPELFEDKIRRIFGNSSGYILTRVTKKIKEEIVAD